MHYFSEKYCLKLGLNPTLRKMILYALIGITAAFLDFCVFYTLRRAFGLPLLLANTNGVCSGIALSFFANRRMNFKVFDRVAGRFFRFATVACVGLTASNALVYVLTLLNVHDALAKIASIFIIGICQFLANNLWTFRSRADCLEIGEVRLEEAKPLFAART
jgi:putative flippase GtrA